MGVDYNGVGGIGIEFTDEHKEIVLSNGSIDHHNYELHDGFPTPDILEELDLEYQCGGDAYGGETVYYLFVPGKNLKEINENSKSFIERLGSIGINITEEDLIVIEDMFVY